MLFVVILFVKALAHPLILNQSKSGRPEFRGMLVLFGVLLITYNFLPICNGSTSPVLSVVNGVFVQ